MARSANVKKEKERDGLSEELKRRLREAGALLLLPLALYLLVCLFSYNDQDPSWGHVGTAEHARNFGGAVGANIANVLRYIFGLVSYCFPLLLLVLGVQVLRNRGETNVQPWEPSLRLIGSVFFFITAPALLYLNFHDEPVLPQGVGGIIGMWVGRGLMHALGDKGAPLLLLALFLVAVTLATGLSWFRVMDVTGQGVVRFAGWFGGKLREAPDALAARQARAEREVVKKVEAVKQAKREPVRIEVPPAPVVKSERAKLETQIPLFTGAAAPGELPPLSLLDEAPEQRARVFRGNPGSAVAPGGAEAQGFPHRGARWSASTPARSLPVSSWSPPPACVARRYRAWTRTSRAAFRWSACAWST